MMAGEAANIQVRCDELAPVTVRRALAQISDLGWVLGDAMLVATELVTNAVRHSQCHEEDELVVSVWRERDLVRVSVRDPGRSGGAARLAEESEPFGHLGLKIVDQLTTRWGTNHDAGGHEVWAELPLVATEEPHQTDGPSRRVIEGPLAI
jgi:anti-sigma regulatory factor (Ser/Thr protein kinase)